MARSQYPGARSQEEVQSEGPRTREDRYGSVGVRGYGEPSVKCAVRSATR